MQLSYIEWRQILGSFRRKADDKQVSVALSQAQKLVDELKRLLGVLEIRLDNRMDTGDVRFTKE